MFLWTTSNLFWLPDFFPPYRLVICVFSNASFFNYTFILYTVSKNEWTLPPVKYGLGKANRFIIKNIWMNVSVLCFTESVDIHGADTICLWISSKNRGLVLSMFWGDSSLTSVCLLLKIIFRRGYNSPLLLKKDIFRRGSSTSFTLSSHPLKNIFKVISLSRDKKENTHTKKK